MKSITHRSGVPAFWCPFLLAGLVGGLIGFSGAVSLAASYSASFDGVNDYITFGAAPGLGGSNFTVECWFRREGAGVSTTTGTGGTTAIPLVTKGRAEVDGNNKDMNYFLGIRASDNVLVADFEEGATGASPGLNHPVAGVTPVEMGTWYHAAVSYDGTNLCLFLNGCLETNVVIGQPPRWDSIQHAAIGSALTSSGAAAGFFKGKVDRVRIWKCARSGEQIMQNMERDSLCADGLAGCWSLDEGSGTVATNSIGNGINGTLLNGVAWVAGTPTLQALGVAAFVPAAQTCQSMASQGYDFGGDNPNATGNYLNIEEASNTSPTQPDGPTAYQLSTFTLECWFRRDGRGFPGNTGGLVEAVPLISKGGGADQVDGVPAQDMNYFLGIALVNGQWVIGADFEDGFGDNHPITGITPIENNVWYHVAATYDGNTWAVYLNGALENSVVDASGCQNASTRRAAIATARDSTTTPTAGGTRISYFNGAMEEIRIWNYARNQAQISAAMGGELVAPIPGLIGYWRLNGNLSDSSDVNGKNNTLTSGGTVVYIFFNRPPFAPVPLSPESGASFGFSPAPPAPPQLQAQVRDPEGNSLEVRFYGRFKHASASENPFGPHVPGPDFTIVAVPDTQYYASSKFGGLPVMFHRQIGWILTNRLASNIVYVAQLGDCAETPNTGEYNILSAGSSDDLHGFYDLEPIPGLADGLPYGIAVGNHDQALNNDPLSGSTALYNQYFGIAHFTPRAYYAGHFGKNGADGFSTGQDVNDNHYDLFSASGLDFVVIYLEFNDLAVPIPNTDPVQYQPSATEEALWEQGLTWADNVLKTYPNRRGIIVSHWIVEHGNPAPFSTPRCGTCGSPATRLYERLRDNPNLTLMLSGHVTQEGRRTDFYGGRKVHSMLSDYQARAGGGNGWLRILQFSPSNNVIRVWTYSPHLDPNVNSAASTAIPYFETDADSQFVLQYDLQHTPFKEIGSPKTVASGGTATSDPWTGLTPGLECEWYVTVSDGCTTNIGPTRTFNMGAYPYYSWAQYQNAAASASSINSQGYFAGWLQESTFPKSAVEWNNTWFYESGGNPPAIVTSLSDPITYSIEAFGINDSQDLVGSAFFYASGLDRAWAKVGAGQLVFLGTPPSRAYRINNGLTIIGYSTVGANIQACRWSWPNQTASIFGPLPSDVSSLALDINDMPQGQADIVGESTSSAGLKRGFVFYESTGAPLQALAGLDRDDQSSAQGVNNAGTVVGCSFRVGQPARAVRWNKSLSTPPTYTVVELGAPQSSPPGTATYAFKISNTGVIVGAAYNPTGFSHIPSGGWRAVVWHDNIGYYLDPIVDSVDRGFFYLKSANDVNDSGRILTVREGAQAVVVGY